MGLFDKSPSTPVQPVALKSVTREDWFQDSSDWMESKMEKTPEGYLTGRAKITNVGVFSYTGPDGKVTRELRPPEEVFHQDSLNSLSMKPLANDHPADLIDCSNIKDHQAGHIGSDCRTDSYCVSFPITVTDPQAVKDVEEGKRALSAGYVCDIENKAGVWMGVEYDCIQRNIRYNHVAIVDRGRAGDAAKLKMDSAGAICTDGHKSQNPIQEDDMNLKVVKIDGVEYSAEAKVIESLTKAEEQLKARSDESDKLTKEISTLKAKLDTATEENTKLKKDLDDAKKTQPEQIEAAVKSKLVLMDTAAKAGVKIEDGMSDMDIRKAIILKASPTAKDKLDKADETYIMARFDSAVEQLSTENKQREDNLEQTGEFTHQDADNEQKADSGKAREKMVNELTSAWKNNTNGGAK